MDYQSRIKVVKAGFTIIRADLCYPLKIQCMRPGSKRFETWQNYPNQMERDKRFRELLDQPKFITD
jgi:hypothetical protein